MIIPLGSLYIANNNKYILSIKDIDTTRIKTIYIFAWTTEIGGWEPKNITVKKGETIRFVIRSMDMTHGFLIPELKVDSGAIEPGYEKIIEIRFDKVGEYTFYCSVYCSPLHYRMTGKIIVVEG
jgi:heme/copper-type cytochrome/quinol oxidase subunit 2